MKTATKPLQTVASVDLERYMGTWYEIARLPARFEDECATDVTATYTLRPDGTVEVLNQCTQADGTATRAEGTARLADPKASGAKLEVSFVVPFLNFLPFVWADYWILELDTEYRYAAVGEPGREYLWILARTPQIDEEILQTLLKRVEAQGYCLEGLIRTHQSAFAATG